MAGVLEIMKGVVSVHGSNTNNVALELRGNFWIDAGRRLICTQNAAALLDNGMKKI